jgi:lipopolysaccharide transport system permease protein
MRSVAGGATRSFRSALHGNPFYYLVEIVRQPLLGHVPDLQVWLVSIVVAMTSILIGTAFHARYRYRVAYWL